MLVLHLPGTPEVPSDPSREPDVQHHLLTDFKVKKDLITKFLINRQRATNEQLIVGQHYPLVTQLQYAEDRLTKSAGNIRF